MKHVFSAALLALFMVCSQSCATSPAPSLSESSLPNITMASAPIDYSAALTRIGFGSCASQDEDQSIWTTIKADDPDLFVFMGDNVYGDVYKDDPRYSDPEIPYLRESYAKLAQSEPFADFRQQTPLLLTWDDHDFGANDGGNEYPFKERAEELFMEAWAVPAGDPRRDHPGVYTSESIGPDGQTVQFIILDTRYFRGPLKKTDDYGAWGQERYVPAPGSDSTMLGESQWDWLEQALNEPADLRFLISSIQIIADGHGWEAWRMLPDERDRLYEMLGAAKADNTILISGDRHSAAFYEQSSSKTGFPLVEMTTSSLNLPASIWRTQSGETRTEQGPNQISPMNYEANYGLADIDWNNRTVTLQIVSPGFDTMTKTVPF